MIERSDLCNCFVTGIAEAAWYCGKLWIEVWFSQCWKEVHDLGGIVVFNSWSLEVEKVVPSIQHLSVEPVPDRRSIVVRFAITSEHIPSLLEAASWEFRNFLVSEAFTA